jgi:hypothetical protein
LGIQACQFVRSAAEECLTNLGPNGQDIFFAGLSELVIHQPGVITNGSLADFFRYCRDSGLVLPESFIGSLRSAIEDLDLHAAVWLKSALIENIIFSPAQAEKLSSAIGEKNFAAANDLSKEDRIELQRTFYVNIPARFRETLMYFSTQVLSPVLHLKGLSADRSFAHILLALGDTIGSCYIEENETADLVQDIRPDYRNAGLQTSASYLVPLHLHTENAGMENVPDFVAIGCVRNNEQAETLVVDPLAVINQMIVEWKFQEVFLLFDEAFTIHSPESFSESKTVAAQSVLKISDGQLLCTADFADMYSTSDAHQAAFKTFEGYCLSAAKQVVLANGEILIMKNTFFPSSLHGRGSFTPSAEDDQQRHLLRVFVRRLLKLEL